MNNRYHFFYIVLLSVLSGMLPAQSDQADRFYAQGDYRKAIAGYEKASGRDDAQLRNYSQLQVAHCYRMLKDYGKAAAQYDQAIRKGDVPADAYYYYGMMLKNLQRYDEALASFKTYVEKEPKDPKAVDALKTSAEISYLKKRPQEYTLQNLQQLNTKGSEFCPVVIGNMLVYTAEDGPKDVIESSPGRSGDKPHLKVMAALIQDHGFGKPASYSKKINTSYYDGPISFPADGNRMYLTRVSYIKKKNQGFVNYAKLYTFSRQETGWSAPIAFPYNSDSYSCAHASISADGNLLFFASDMPGGFGGKDIWMCRRNGDSWERPVNLGAEINTAGDEMFPYIRPDGMLFFASDGLPGFGGLDVFSARRIGQKWLLRRNEGQGLNTNADDFGIVFTSDSTGYVSSNREGGKGSDDLYRFGYRSHSVKIEGSVLLTKNPEDPAKYVHVFLVDSTFKRLDSTLTDEKGHFSFEDLDVEKTYLTELENADVTFKGKAHYYLMDKQGNVVRVSHRQNGANFVFRNLPVEASPLTDLSDDEGTLNIAGTILFGSNPAKPVAGKKVIITNRFRDIVEETYTSQLGAFAFRNLDVGQDYFIALEDDSLPDQVRIILTNKDGKEVKVLSGSKGKFAFDLLAVDKSSLQDLSVADEELTMALKGKVCDQDKKPLSNARILILDKHNVVQNILTDEKGRFEFRNLNPDKTYLFSLDDSEQQFTQVSKIFISDAKGNLYKELPRDKSHKFQYALLDIDKDALGEFSVDDPWLQLINLKSSIGTPEVTIIENITYESGSYKPDEAGAHILDKVISVLKSNPELKIELSSHTDSKGSDAYNMQLSQKRAKAAVAYLISKGITSSRLKAIGYGETHLLNACANDVPCSETEHALNRRTEFRILEGRHSK